MISRRLLARSVADSLADGDSRNHVLQQLAAYIVTHRLHKQVAMIINDIEAELAQRGTVVVRITSASPLTDALRAQIEDYVKSEMGADSVSLDETVDPSILGGVVIRTPHKTLDASVATKLKRLKTT